MTVLAIAVALFFAMNIGASGAAAAMGTTFGSGAIKKKRIALVLCSVGVVLGASFGGQEVAETIGSGVIPSSIINLKVVLIILFSATMSLFIANMLGIPLSTSEVTVGAVIGVGIASQILFVEKLFFLLLIWILVPISAFLIALLSAKGIKLLENHSTAIHQPNWQKRFTFILIGAGFLEAVAAGMNNVGNAVGPLIGAGVLSMNTGTVVGGIFVALGVLLFGGKVLETNGKRITRFSLIEGCSITSIGAGLVIAASILGIPVPLTQITTSAIMGVGAGKSGQILFKKRIIKRMLMVWAVSPVFSLVFSYGLVKLFLESDMYSLVAIGSMFLATVGSLYLIKTVREEKAMINEQGSGI
ncbi:inorganic phosphate transporter [Pontibacillus yanchengensis]|uniref:Inorganic phosphate transporter n=1 Tax=Pontibacillus yanchengensis TaxID=462910 RepID=A0ACC7VH64_9BACI|nr:inorganic phosphate transporter [Pontibacillus yanchengensis]MYL54311.1 inorganic phosphate transporter [Pontibacillus yanchengensis]